ncbi:MAG: hypothetical protein H0W34_12220 [Pyrinomonadaceae bacterium]|nr:hypothetical protein [Pyrinomonadaceae bacterium]
MHKRFVDEGFDVLAQASRFEGFMDEAIRGALFEMETFDEKNDFELPSDDC